MLSGCLLAVALAAQVPGQVWGPGLAIERRRCPFEDPQLSSRDPAEVAWAAAQLKPDCIEQPEVVAELRLALARMQKGQSEEHEQAVLLLLHAALQNGVTIPLSELRFEPEANAHIPHVALQVRAATKDGDLFELFQRLDEQDSAWEFVGGSLAIRGHGAFAIELRTHMTPVLHIEIQVEQLRGTLPKLTEFAGPLADFPELHHYRWDRDKSGTIAPAFGPIGLRKTLAVAYSMGTVQYDIREANERARLRWLATLAGESSPVAWSKRFFSRFRFPEQGIAEFEGFAEHTEQRARELLATADAKLRARFELSDRVTFPELEVVWHDRRTQRDRTDQPLPERR